MIRKRCNINNNNNNSLRNLHFFNFLIILSVMDYLIILNIKINNKIGEAVKKNQGLIV